MSSKTKSITYADLARVLTQIGFVLERPTHTYQLFFRHSTPEILIVLPARGAGDIVDVAHLLAVRTHVLENGLLDEAAFDALLGGGEHSAASQ
jgi:hypothetical protein